MNTRSSILEQTVGGVRSVGSVRSVFQEVPSFSFPPSFLSSCLVRVLSLRYGYGLSLSLSCLSVLSETLLLHIICLSTQKVLMDLKTSRVATFRLSMDLFETVQLGRTFQTLPLLLLQNITALFSRTALLFHKSTKNTRRQEEQTLLLYQSTHTFTQPSITSSTFRSQP